MSNVSNKKSKVVIIDPSAPVRQMLSETMRQALGFENVESMGSIDDVLKFLETDTIDWILTPLYADQPANALHLLKIVSEYPELKKVRVSLFIDPSESYVLPAAFELGAISWHKKPTIKDAVKTEIGALLAVLESNGGNEPLTAAHFLAMHLKEVNQHEDMLQLYKTLLKMYPGNGKILLEMAEPYFRLQQPQNAQRVIKQALLIDEKLKDKVDQLSQSLFQKSSDELDASEGGSGDEGALAVESCIIIDSDDAVCQGVSDLLSPLGVKNIARFNDGEEAWEHLEKNPEPHLIIMEWRIPKLSGPLLIQRIRNHGFLNVPIIILSSLLKPDDMPLLKEMGAANIVQKPLNKDRFIPACIWTIQQDRLPTEHQALERKIRQLLAGKKFEEAESLKGNFLSDTKIPIAKKKLVEAEFAFAKGDFTSARDNAIESLKHAGDSILVLNILGKTFMRLSQFDAAIKCFNKAQEISPHNIERLCNIAESQTDLGNSEAAAEALEDAGTLDPDSKTVSDSQIKCAISAGNTEEAKNLMSRLDSLDSLVAYMNNKAVAFAKTGAATDAAELYKKTINSIPDDRHETKAIVLYNLALAQVRESEIEAGITILDQVLVLNKNKVTAKAKSLKERLAKALADGTEFKLKSAEAPGKGAPGTPGATRATDTANHNHTNDGEYREIIASVTANKGDLCCFMLFHPVTERDARLAPLFAKQPRFQKRNAISREEALGAERIAKESA